MTAEQLLFSQGDPASRFYLLLSGQMRLFRLSPEGAEKVIEIVSPGQTFAEALMFLNAPRYPVCAAALADSELIAIDSSDFAAMLRESVDTCFVLLGALSQRLRGLIGEIDALAAYRDQPRRPLSGLATAARGRVARTRGVQGGIGLAVVGAA
ncbi:MAG: Crp/Fnr family transcriptional regulator [Thermochromatium sp.]